VEPELAPEPLAEPVDPAAMDPAGPMEDPALSESETKELEDSPLDPEEESHGVIVVVKVTRMVGSAGASVAAAAAPTSAARTRVRVDTMMAGRLSLPERQQQQQVAK